MLYKTQQKLLLHKLTINCDVSSFLVQSRNISRSSESSVYNTSICDFITCVIDVSVQQTMDGIMSNIAYQHM